MVGLKGPRKEGGWYPLLEILAFFRGQGIRFTNHWNQVGHFTQVLHGLDVQGLQTGVQHEVPCL